VTQGNPSSSGQQTPEMNTQARNAIRVIALFAFSSLSVLGFLVFQAARTPSTPQLWTIVGVVAIVIAFMFAGLVLARGGRHEMGIWLAVVPWLLLLVIIVVFVSGLGYVFMAVSIAIITLISGRTLPNRQAESLNIVGVVVAVIILLVDLFIPTERIAIPGFESVAIVVVGAFIVIFGYFIARRAWSGNIRLKVITGFTVVAFISLGILGTMTYFNYRTRVRENFRQRLVNMVSIAALQQDGDLHAAIQNPGDEETEAYKQIQAINKAIVATEPEVGYLYTMRMNDQGQIHFFVDAGQPGDDDLATVAEFFEESTPLMRTTFHSLDHAVAEEQFNTDRWGTWLSAYAPFYNSNGDLEGIIGMDIGASTVIAAERAVLYLILGTTAGAMVIVTLLGLWLGNIFTKPVLNLSSVAQLVSKGDLSARAKIESADEIGDLATTFNTMTSQLQATLGSLEQQVENRTRALEASTEVSRRLSTILDQEQLVREVVEQLQTVFGYYHAHIYLYDEARQTLLMAGGTGDAGRTMLSRGHSIEKGRGLVGRAAESNAAVLVSDTSLAQDWLPNPLLPETRAELAVPIAIGREVLGVLDVQHNITNGLAQEDADLVQAVANQVAIAVQNAQAYTRAQEEAEREATIASIGQRIQGAGSVEDALQIAVSELGQALGAKVAQVELSLPTEQP
jgi:HAMP domain-containing protein